MLAAVQLLVYVMHSPVRHVIFMRICDCRIYMHFFAYFSKVRILHIFLHKMAFSTAIFILFVFLLPISIKFRYLDHLFVNRMAPCMRLDLCGTRCCSWFPAVLYHTSAYFHRIFGVYAIRIFLIKMPHKTDMPIQSLAAVVMIIVKVTCIKSSL